MRFTCGGMTFRIVFRHDRSRLLADHIGHKVCLARATANKRIHLWCSDCKLKIGCTHTLPVSMLERKTWCVIQVLKPKPACGRSEWVDVMTGCGNPNEDAGDRFNRKDGRRHAIANALAHSNFERDGDEGKGEDPNAGYPSDNLIAADIPILASIRSAFKTAAWHAFDNRGKKAATPVAAQNG